MDFELKKSGQIPAFGNWDYSNDLPITQYFECARQAGLIRGNASSFCECPPCSASRRGGVGDLYYAADFEKPPVRLVAAIPPSRNTTRVNNGYGNKTTRKSSADIVIKEQRKQQQVAKEHQPMNHYLSQKTQFPKQKTDRLINQRPNVNIIKPVDEDLYKIPPDLLHGKKRKKMLGFFSRCLVPPCKA